MQSISDHLGPVLLKEQVYASLTLKQAERFWTYVQLCDHEPPCRACCWEWQGATASQRHYGHYRTGTIGTGYKHFGAHRLAWVLVYGEVQLGLWVLHHCDNPPCCNPAHLWLGTTEENTSDSVTKGRRARGERSGSRLHPERRARGEGHGLAKLTTQQVYAIRALQGKVPRHILAQQFGTSTNNVYRIQRRTAWAHLPDIDAENEDTENPS